MLVLTSWQPNTDFLNEREGPSSFFFLPAFTAVLTHA